MTRAAPLPDRRLSFGPGEVQVWRASLDAGAAELQRARALLSPEEQDRTVRYRFEPDAARFAMRRGILRILLSRYLGQPAREVALRVNEHGRPSLLEPAPGTTLHFSISHSHATALYAFAPGRAVGIDVEHIGVDIAGPVRAIVGDDIPEAGTMADDHRLRLGYRLWVRAEACLKATGKGLPGAGSFLGSGGAPERMAGKVLRTPTGELRVWDLGKGHVHAAALAVEGPGEVKVRVLRLSPRGGIFGADSDESLYS